MRYLASAQVKIFFLLEVYFIFWAEIRGSPLPTHSGLLIIELIFKNDGHKNFLHVTHTLSVKLF